MFKALRRQRHASYFQPCINLQCVFYSTGLEDKRDVEKWQSYLLMRCVDNITKVDNLMQESLSGLVV